jgi:hypothetical protein
MAAIEGLTMKQRFGTLVNSEDMHDVVFTFPGSDGNSKTTRIFGHKMVLSVGSAVFKAMFFGSLAEKGKEVTVVDIEAHIFLQLLTYLYTDDVTLGEDTALDIMYAAKKYDVPGLQKQCLDYLVSIVSWNNAVTIYNQSILLDEMALEQRCFEVMDKSAHNIINDNGQVSLIDLPLLCLLLKRDTFCAREVDIFDAMVWWAKNQLPDNEKSPVHIRRILKNAFFLIRFPCMTLKEIVQIVVPSGLLEPMELLDILKHYEDKLKSKVKEEGMATSMFSKTRRWLQKEVTISAFDVPINRHSLVPEVPHFERVSNLGMRSIKFKASCRMFLTKMMVSNVPHRFSLDKYTATLRVLDLDLDEVLYRRDYALIRKDTLPKSATFELTVDEDHSIELCPRISYEIVLSIEPPLLSGQSKSVQINGKPSEGSISLEYYGRVFKEDAQIDKIYFMI